MSIQRVNGHTVSRLTVHIVWITNYRYSVLKGVVSHDHIHIEYRPSQDISSIVKKLKGRTSRKIQQEFPALRKKYWGRHFGR